MADTRELCLDYLNYLPLRLHLYLISSLKDTSPTEIRAHPNLPGFILTGLYLQSHFSQRNAGSINMFPKIFSTDPVNKVKQESERRM